MLLDLQRNLLYCALRFANLEGILGFSVLLIILVKAGLMQIRTRASKRSAKMIDGTEKPKVRKTHVARYNEFRYK